MTEQEILNERILNITKVIRAKYSELLQYIEEADQRLPKRLRQDITHENLKSYYDSVDSLLNRYILELSGELKIKETTV